MNAFGSKSEYIDGWAAYKSGDYKTAFEMWSKGAEQGLAKAQFSLGGMYERGEGVAQDYNQALSWYRKAADQGNADAQFNLGLMYGKGIGVPQDDTQSLFWFRKAANQGDSKAQINLGFLYLNGRGVPQDNVEALKWFMLAPACETDEEIRDRAIKSLDLVSNELSSEQAAEAQRRVVDDPMFDPSPAYIISRVTEWRKETAVVFDGMFQKYAARSKDSERDLKSEKYDDATKAEIVKSFRETCTFYGLHSKYEETMWRLSRFLNDNVLVENSNLPKVAWWQKLKKLFEIEESFYKQAREAFASNNLDDCEIFSGLAKEVLEQIRNSVEKAASPSPVASPEKVSESTQESKASLSLLGKVVQFYFQYEGLIFLAVVSFFLGMQAPTNVGSGHPFVDGLVSAILYGVGSYLIYGFCKVAKELAVSAKAAAVESELSSSRRKYVRVFVTITAIVYGSAFLEAKTNPWTLWKRSWHQDDRVEMKNVGRFTTTESCIAQQWKSLNQERTMINEAEKSTKDLFPDLKSVFIVQGRTIFGFWKSFYMRSPELRDKLVSDLEKRTDLSAFQKQNLLDDYLRPEIVSTVSFFCAPTSSNALWPFNTPSYYAPGEALTDLGERVLASRAGKLLTE